VFSGFIEIWLGVARFINTNFASTRSGLSEFKGALAPSSMLIINADGDVVLTTVGLIPPDQIISVLAKAMQMNERIMEMKHGPKVHPGSEAIAPHIPTFQTNNF